MDWLYIDRNQKQHPFDEVALGELVKNGTIASSTLLWNDSMADWQPAGTLFPAWFPGETVATSAAETAQPPAAGNPPESFEEMPPTPGVPAAAEFEKSELPALEDVPARKSVAETRPARVRKASAGTFERVELIKDFASYLNANRGWIKFFGVLSIIQGSLLCLSIGGALIGWLPIWLGVNVFQAAKAADLAERTGSREYMEEALYRLGFFFKLNGIVFVAIFAFFVIAIIVILVSGVLAGIGSLVPASA